MTHDSREKFWMFYTRDMREELYLYAFTDKKSLAENFKKTRHMSNFYIKSCRLDRHDYNDLIRHHMTCELELVKINLPSEKKHIEQEIALTMSERMFLMRERSLIRNETIHQYTIFDANLLVPKYRIALETLGYYHFYKFFNDGESYNDWDKRIVVDDFALLMSAYGWTFKEAE